MSMNGAGSECDHIFWVGVVDVTSVWTHTDVPSHVDCISFLFFADLFLLLKFMDVF